MFNNLIHKARLRAVQIHLDGLDAVIETVSHPGIKNDFLERRYEIKRKLHRMEGAYKEACVRMDKWEVV